MKSTPFTLSTLALLTLTAPLATAAITATGTVTPTSIGSGLYSNTISLQNTGTTTIGTFWFAWVPGQNYLGSAPTGITSPAGWTATVTHGSATDGYGIRWTTSFAASYLAAGSSLAGFGFTNADGPTVLAGNSPFYASTPTTTSYVYITSAFGDPGARFSLNVIPTPSAAALLTTGLLAPLSRRRRR